MSFLVDDLVAWLISSLADASRQKLVNWTLGPEQGRALQQAATAAVHSVAGELLPGADEQGEFLAMVISQVLNSPVTGPPLSTEATFLETLQTGVASQVARLDDVSLTGTGKSSAQILGISASTLADRLTAHLVREILTRGSRGGPLEPLASQLNHDITHLQGQRLQETVGQLISDVQKAIANPQEQSPSGTHLAILQAAAAGYLFDTQGIPDDYIPLGSVEDDGHTLLFGVPTSLFQHNVIIAGANCNEKFWTTRCVLDKLHRRGVAWLAVEPTHPYEIDVKTTVGSITTYDGRIIIMGGDDEFVPVTFNPLEPEDSFPLSSHLELLMALFRTTVFSDADDGLARDLFTTLRKAYTSCGWNMDFVDGLPPRFPHPYFPKLRDLKGGSWRSSEFEIQGAHQDAIDTSMERLLAGLGRWWLQDGSRIDMGGMLSERASARMAAVPDEAKGLIIGTMLMRIFECVKMGTGNGRRDGLRHVSWIKNASLIFPNSMPTLSSKAALETIERTLLEMRYCGEGLILDEEYPARLKSSVLQSAAVKIIHRLATSDDQSAVTVAVRGGQDIASRMMTLRPGHAMVLAEGMDKPLEVSLQLSTFFRIL